MKLQRQLLVIDPQNDFCDFPAAELPDLGSVRPALPVPGANADMQRLAALIRASGDSLDQITVTLDSHHRLDIAHPGFWRTQQGHEVAPFTPITARQLRSAEFQPRRPEDLERAQAYVDALEANGRYGLMVWPVHCEVGTWGHAVHADLLAACTDWETRQSRSVHWVRKGENPWTEHYSALRAEVPDPADPGTALNTALLARLAGADLLLIAGEASSHCVRATTEHIVEHLPPNPQRRIMLLTDAMSPVPGFEAQQDAFLTEMQARGLSLMRTAKALACLNASVAA